MIGGVSPRISMRPASAGHKGPSLFAGNKSRSNKMSSSGNLVTSIIHFGSIPCLNGVDVFCFVA